MKKIILALWLVLLCSIATGQQYPVKKSNAIPSYRTIPAGVTVKPVGAGRISTFYQKADGKFYYMDNATETELVLGSGTDQAAPWDAAKQPYAVGDVVTARTLQDNYPTPRVWQLQTLQPNTAVFEHRDRFSTVFYWQDLGEVKEADFDKSRHIADGSTYDWVLEPLTEGRILTLFISGVNASFDATGLNLSIWNGTTYVDEPTDVSVLQVGHIYQASVSDGAPNVVLLRDLTEEFQATALSDAEFQSRTSTTIGSVSGKSEFDREQALKGTSPNFLSTDADYSIAKSWDAATLENQYGYEAYITPANNSTLEVGKRYTISTETVNAPTTRADGSALINGDWFVLKNDRDILTMGGGPLNRGLLQGALRTPDGFDIPAFPIAPNLEFIVTYTAGTGRWSSAIMAEQTVFPSNIHNTQEFRGGVNYEVNGSTAGMNFSMPIIPRGICRIRLLSNSTQPVTINDFDTGDGNEQFIVEDGTVANTFEIPLSKRGQQVVLVGDGTNWRVYRPWEIEELNNNATPWLPNTAYSVGHVVTQNRLSDNVLSFFIWDDGVNNGGTPTDGTSGAVWDAAEESRWIESGAVPNVLPILETVTVTSARAFAGASALNSPVFVDALGSDYDPNDFSVISDSEGLIPPGTIATGLSFPVATGTRDVVFRYTGNSQRRGFSGLKINIRQRVTYVSGVSARYFDGSIASATYGFTSHSPVQGDGAYTAATYNLDETGDFDFLTTVVTSVSEIDAAAPWDTDIDYVDEDRVPFIIEVPATDANGPFVTLDGQTLTPGSRVVLIYDVNRTAVNSVPTIADDAATVAEILLMDFIGQAPVPNILLGRLAPVNRVVSSPTSLPFAGEPPLSRLLYNFASGSSQIYEYDNAGTNPTVVTNPGIGAWEHGTLVRDNETGDDWVFGVGAAFTKVVNASSSLTPLAITADPSDALENHLYVSTYTGPFTLPSYAALPVGWSTELLNTDGSDVTITPAAGEVINGLIADATLLAGREDGIWKIIYDGIDWSVTSDPMSVPTAIGSYIFSGDGAAGFNWVDGFNKNVSGKITNNGTAGHTLSGGIYKVSYSASKTTNSGTAIVAVQVDGATVFSARTRTDAGASWNRIIDATTTDVVVRFVRTASSGNGNTDAELTIREVKENLQVLDLPANDQSTSGYMDVGGMRMQWGRVTATGYSVTTLPAPFANTDYVITTSTDAGTGVVPGPTSVWAGVVGAKTTTTFGLRSLFATSTSEGNSGQDVSWIAIGQKP